MAQVIQFIRSSRELHSGELVLIVRPNGESSGWISGSSVFFCPAVFRLFCVGQGFIDAGR